MAQYVYPSGTQYRGYPSGYPPPPPPPVAQPYGQPPVGSTAVVYEIPVDQYGNPIYLNQGQPVYVKGPAGSGPYYYNRNQYYRDPYASNYYGGGAGGGSGDEALACCAGLCAALACCGLMDLMF
eukprot:jgi/Galph1/1110/GphlegSOOS_G5836.1